MSAELALLRLIVREDRAALRLALSDPSIDLTGFLRFAHRHQLGPYFCWSLKQLGLTHDLSPRILVAMKAASLVERMTSESLALQLRALGELFERGGAKVLFMKGPLFAQRFYGSLEARAVFDLDILIRSPEELELVEALLLETGFEPAFHVPLSRRLSRYFVHHFEYRRNALPLDVHWALQSHFTFAIDYPRLWATTSRVELAGRTYESTSHEYELVLQILGVLTDLQVGKLALRSLVDIYRVLRSVEGTLDWGEFFSWRKRERIHRPSVYALGLALAVFDCHDDFPTLWTALEPMLRPLPPTRPAFHAVLASSPLDLRQKLLALRIYETPLAASLSWWLVSLPFRLAVHGFTRRPLRGA